jgi:maltodextrin utilization protein YvdJ
MSELDQPDVAGTMSVTEVTGLVNLFNGMLMAMEGRLIAKMDDNSRQAIANWVRHDQELAANTKRIVDRFEKIESSLLKVETCLQVHLDQEHEERIATEARVKPVVMSIQWFTKNWRTILLFIVATLAILGFSGETADKLLRSMP